MKPAEELIASADALILDFDGPVASLMPPPKNAEAAAAARKPLTGLDLPAEVLDSIDHLTVLRWTLQHAPSRLRAVEEACTRAEVDCAAVARPSPEAGWLRTTAIARELPTAIVSNNSEEAVTAFMSRAGWPVDVYACRTADNVRLMKPSPFLVQVAVEVLGADAARCVFVGDSVSDMQAGTAAGVQVVGIAKDSRRGEELTAGGALALILR